MLPGDQVRHWAPPEAYFYRLVYSDSAGGQRSIPKEPTDYLFIRSSPPALPPGRYQIIYFNMTGDQLDRVGSLVVGERADNQLALQLDRAGSAPAGSAAKAETAEEGDQEEDAEEDEEEEADEDDAGDDEEAQDASHKDLRLLKMQLRLERHQQRFIRSAKYTQEIGETHHLNALLRRELVEANRHVAQAHKHAFADIKRIREEHHAMREEFRGVMDLWDEAMERAASKLAAPPPPPTDYTGLGQSALHLLEKIGVALISKNAPAAALPPAQSEAERPALQGSASPEDKTPSKSAQAAPQPAAAGSPSPLSRLGAKLASMGELEIAQRMTSAGGWKALFDELSADIEGTPSSAPLTQALKDE